jgi:hypothetical protein
MKERPALFKGAMVCALLRDIDPKTQTRRIMVNQPMGQSMGRVDVRNKGLAEIASILREAREDLTEDNARFAQDAGNHQQLKEM